MNVGELIDKLSGLDKGLPVYFWCEDDDLTAPFDIVSISETKTERSRDEDRKPQFKFDGGKNSEAVVIFEITTIF